MLNRLVLLTAGNDPKLAELFARAELRRGRLRAAATSALSADWVTAAQNPLSARPALERFENVAVTSAFRQDVGFYETF